MGTWTVSEVRRPAVAASVVCQLLMFVGIITDRRLRVSSLVVWPANRSIRVTVWKLHWGGVLTKLRVLLFGISLVCSREIVQFATFSYSAGGRRNVDIEIKKERERERETDRK